MKNRLLILLTTFLFLSCGSGTFENDPKSWNKVFGENIPEEIEIINSRFWKSMHWTYEFEFFCKLKSDQKFLNQYFIEHYNMKERKEKMVFHSDNKPKWFIFNEENFKVWEKEFQMTLYFNEKSNEAYLHCIQF